MQRWEMLFNMLRTLPQEKFDAMVKAYAKYRNTKRFLDLNDKDLADMPMEMYMSLLPNVINDVWNRFPLEYRENREFQSYLRCTEHFKIPGIEFDGPNPLRRDCVLCLRTSRADV